MRPETREMLREAFEQDDAARADFERQSTQLSTRRQHDRDEVIRKTYEPQPMKQPAVMDEKSAAAWNEWAINIAREMAFSTFDKNIRVFADITGEAMAERDDKLRDELQGQIDGLQGQIEALRAEIDELRSEVMLSRGLVGGTVRTLRGRHADDAA